MLDAPLSLALYVRLTNHNNMYSTEKNIRKNQLSASGSVH